MNVSYSFDPPKGGLQQQVRKNVMIAFVAQGVKFLLTMASTVVLARLLEPADYGLLAMAAAVNGLLGAIRDGGLSSAAIQRPNITHLEVSGLFWLNIYLGLLVVVVSVPVGLIASRLMHEPRMFLLISSLGLVGLIGSFGVQHSTLMSRRLETLELMKRDVIGQFLGLVGGIAAAVWGAGYWALIMQQLVAALATCMLTWSFCEWRPEGPKSVQHCWHLLSFGWNVMVVNLISRASTGIDSIFFGSFFGTETAGLYNRAQNLLKRPLDQVLSPMMNTLRPALSRAAERPERLRKVSIELLGMVSLVTGLCVTVVAPVSDCLILVLLGEKWLGATPIFQALCIFAFVEPCASLLTGVLVAAGRPGVLVYWKVCSLVIIVLGLVCAVSFGPVAVAYAYALSGVLLRLPLFVLVVSTCVGLDKRSAYQAVFAAILPGLITSFFAFYLRALLSLNLFVECLLTGFFSTSVYIGICRTFYLTRAHFAFTSDQIMMSFGARKGKVVQG